jgi:hypothetical protein
MSAEFKIGRLRYSWSGTWTPGIVYTRDNVVLNQGKAYVCILGNTASSNFYNDYYATFPCWTQMTDGKTWIGPWSTSGSYYSVGDIVLFGGKAYTCTATHEPTDFASDAVNWTEYTEFSNWQPVWTTSTAYGLNDVVRWGGNVYKCVTNHTSAAAIDLGLEANISAWTVYYRGIDYKGVWASGTRYKLNDLVRVDANIYLCSTYNKDSTFTPSNWTMWLPGQMFDFVWSNLTTYQIGDTVVYGGDSYVSKTANNLGNIPSSDIINWKLFNLGFSLRGDWASTSSYAVGDVVRRSSMLYEAVQDSNSLNIQDPASSTTSVTYASLGSSGNILVTTSVANVVPGMIASGPNISNGQTVSSTNLSIATDTSSSISGYTLTVGGTVTGTFSVGMLLATTTGVLPSTYITAGSGTTWTVSVSQTIGPISIQGTLNTITLSSPPTGTPTDGQIIYFNGINSIYWSLLAPGKLWKHVWTNGVNYLVGDTVMWSNTSYYCIKSHSSYYSLTTPTNNNRPDLDSTHTYWVILTVGNLRNALTTPGDLETYTTGPGNTVIPIGNTSYVLRNSNNVPNWQQINIVPAVYYVDTYNGVDSGNYGTSWDRPWKTINYSCNFIGQGQYFANATNLLQANKAWMISEMYQWMRYQMANSISPFSPDSLWDPFITQRDAGYIIDAIIYDMQRGGNSQIVAATLKFFYYGSKTQVISSRVEASIVYYTPSLTYLLILMQCAITRTPPPVSYQTQNGLSGSSVVYQVFTTANSEPGASLEIYSLLNIVTTALTNQNTYAVPSSNSGTTAILNIKTGTYNESLPIIVPENVSIVGDELRSVAVQPATSIQIFCTQTLGSTNLTPNRIIVTDASNLVPQMPLQFISPFVNNASTTFGDVVSGQTYYVVNITGNTFQLHDSKSFLFTGTTTAGTSTISNVNNITNLVVGMQLSGLGIPSGTTVLGYSQAISGVSTITVSSILTSSNIFSTILADGNIVQLIDGTGNMLVYAGDCLKNMWLMRNGTTMRNLSNFGLLGTLTQANQYGTSRPTGGAYVSLDPGSGPDDTSVWIFRRSPYVQNVTNFGTGCIGYKIDGTLHNGGNKSIVANDFTMVLSDGIGIWCYGSGSVTEAVSVFAYYCYSGYFAEAGGRIRATNGNSSYGNYGVISEGYDLNETPVTGTIYNQSLQVQASVTQAFGTADQLLKLNFSNAGSAYYLPSTNMLQYSNNFTSNWTTDSNLSFIKNEIAPTGYTEAWLLTGAQNTPGTGYIQQAVSINPSGYSYTSIAGATQRGALGAAALFDIVVTNTAYVVTVHAGAPGSNYQIGNLILVKGSVLGGLDNTNDLLFAVATTTGTGIATVNTVGTITLGGTLYTLGGTVPAGSSQNYTLSMYVYPGTSQTVDLQVIFSGVTTVTSGISYNVTTNTVTAYSGQSLTNGTNGGLVPTAYGALKTLVAGWYRIWISVSDTQGINTSLTYKFFPQGANNPIANTYSIIYGSQLELSGNSPPPDFYLETTNQMNTAYANFQVSGAGSGANLVGDESRSNSVFNCRVTTDNNGYTGGQGYVSANNTAQAGNTYSIQLAGSDPGLYNYLGMRVFVQSGTGAGQYGYVSYYNKLTTTDANGIAAQTALICKETFEQLTVLSASYSATAANNILTLASGTDLSKLYVNQSVQFMPTYYTTTVTNTSVSTLLATETIGGTVNTIKIPTASLAVNMPVTFAGSGFNITPGFVYYIVNVDKLHGTIQISSTLAGNPIELSNVLLAANRNMIMTYPRYSGYLTGITTNMTPTISIQFTGVAIGGITLGTTYYINDIIDSNNFTISTIRVSVVSAATTGGITNTVTADASGLIPLAPVIFGGTIFDAAITAGLVYYISSIASDTASFGIATGIIRTTATDTEYSTNLITLATVTNMATGSPIIFSGIAPYTSFGNIVSETVYYIQTINPGANQITITSDSALINQVQLTTAVGLIFARTSDSTLGISLGGGTGSMTVTSTGIKLMVTQSIGQITTMNATFSTTLFGGVNSYSLYYINAIVPGTNPTIGISATMGGNNKSLTTGVGSMKLGASGWDNINSGTSVSATLDTSSAYYIEPVVQFSPPPSTQVLGTVTTPLLTGNWKKIVSGNNYFLAIPSLGTIGGSSTDGQTWSSMTLPSNGTAWVDIAFGNFYWIAIGSAGATSIAAYSNSSGQAWRTVNLPVNATWSNIIYGNGIFVATTSNDTTTAYSTNFGRTWTLSYRPSNHLFTASGDAQISTAQFKAGSSSLQLSGSGSISSPSSIDFAYGTGDFTIECWIRPSAIGSSQPIFDQRTTATEVALTLDFSGSGQLRLFINGSYRITGNSIISATTWTHVAVSRSSGTTRLFVGGTVQSSTYSDANNYGAKPIVIGTYYNGGFMTGYIDEFRITKGFGRYTTTFTPPAVIPSVDAFTYTLLHFEGTNTSTVIVNSTISGSLVDLKYGSNIFFATTSTGAGARSLDGITWTGTTLPQYTAILTGIVITGSAGTFTCNAQSSQLVLGQSIVVSGTNTTGDGSSITNGTYYINTTNGKTSFTLSSTYPVYTGITTAAGSPNQTFNVGSPAYTSLAWGDNRFLAVQNGFGLYSAYSFDGITWGQSLTYISGDLVVYGQGVFVVVQSTGSTSYKSEAGIFWKQRTLTYGNIKSIGFGLNASNVGIFPTLSNTGSSSGDATTITEGALPQARTSISSGVITSVNLWETGSNYSSQPTVAFYDYNSQVNAQATARTSNGVLSNPTFANRGTGYSTTSTLVTISGNGYADSYQTGYTLIINNLTSLPLVGSNLTVVGNSQVYKVTSAVAVFGTQAPFIEANVQVSPTMTTTLSPGNGAGVSLRQLYSQCRLTNHDFLSIGVGNKTQSGYPIIDSTTAKSQNQAVETNQGHVFWTSTDENGNFVVGGLFGVQQATGTVTLSATQFGLSGLQTLSLGGIAVGSSSVVVSQFSTDSTFVSNSDVIVPTQKAIKSYLTGRLSQGGANTYTGTLVAGTVLVGNPNLIGSTVLAGQIGSSIKMVQKVYFNGKGVDGNMAALDFFLRGALHR